jgi:hypothetical protein
VIVKTPADEYLLYTSYIMYMIQVYLYSYIYYNNILSNIYWIALCRRLIIFTVMCTYRPIYHIVWPQTRRLSLRYVCCIRMNMFNFLCICIARIIYIHCNLIWSLYPLSQTQLTLLMFDEPLLSNKSFKWFIHSCNSLSKYVLCVWVYMHSRLIMRRIYECVYIILSYILYI